MYFRIQLLLSIQCSAHVWDLSMHYIQLSKYTVILLTKTNMSISSRGYGLVITYIYISLVSAQTSTAINPTTVEGRARRNYTWTHIIGMWFRTTLSWRMATWQRARQGELSCLHTPIPELCNAKECYSNGCIDSESWTFSFHHKGYKIEHHLHLFIQSSMYQSLHIIRQTQRERIAHIRCHRNS